MSVVRRVLDNKSAFQVVGLPMTVEALQPLGKEFAFQAAGLPMTVEALQPLGKEFAFLLGGQVMSVLLTSSQLRDYV